MFVPKCAEIIRCDEEQNIVIRATNSFTNILEEIKSDVFAGAGHKEAIMNCVIDLLTQKVKYIFCVGGEICVYFV